jgi:hypothetical protein
LAYASSRGHAFIARKLFLPKELAEDKKRRQRAGVPDFVTFAKKPQLSRKMFERASTAGVKLSWFKGDEVYGKDRKLRLWLEGIEQPIVLAVLALDLWATTTPSQSPVFSLGPAFAKGNIFGLPVVFQFIIGSENRVLIPPVYLFFKLCRC